MNLKPLSVAFRILCYIVFLHFIHIHFMRPCYCVFISVCICVHLTDFLKTSLRKLAVNCMSERASKGRFLKPDKLQNHSNEVKGKEKKKSDEKERRRREKKSNGCAVSFYNGYFGDFAFSKIRLDIHVYQFTYFCI